MSWQPLTQGSAADTQATLERLVGMSRATFQASGYLAQRQSDSFTGAQPRDRKRLLADALGLDAWDLSRDAVAADRRAREKQHAEAAARAEALAERAAAADQLAAQAAALQTVVDAETAAANEAREAAETEASRAHDLDQAETAWQVRSAAVQAARARHDAHLALLERTAAAKEQRDQAQQELAGLGDPAGLEELEQQERDLIDQAGRYDKALADFDAATVRRDTLAVQAETKKDRAEGLRAQATLVLEQVGDVHCPVCAQTMGEEAAETAAATFRAQAADHDREADELQKQAAAVDVPALPAPPDRGALAEVRSVLAGARAAATRRTQIETQLQGFDATIGETDNDGYRDTARRLAYELEEALRALACLSQPEPGAAAHARARATQAAAKAQAHDVKARQAAEQLAATRALADQAIQAQQEHAAAAAERDRLADEIGLLAQLEQAFGRDGVPAWIVEQQAIPHIESEANRILARLGGAISRVELRTERETKAGDKRDALDIVCVTGDGERPLETFSGGEQSRAEIALALGLVDVLAARRDTDLRYLALDEPSGLDAQGTEALADLLRERAAGRVVLLASHDGNLRDQFDQAVVVVRGPSGSQVVA